MAKNVTIGNKTYTGINKIKVKIPETETYHEFFVTDDATATPEDILIGKTAYANNQKVTGTLEGGGGLDTSLVYQDLEDEYSLEITNVDVSYKYLVVFCRANFQYYPDSMIYIYHDGSSWRYNRDFYRGYSSSSVSVSVTDDNLILNLYSNENTSSNLHAYIFKVVSEFPTPVPIKNNYFTCFIKDTPITLADRTYKLVQDITYQDDLLVWDFDSAAFTSAKPLWIQKQKQALKYNHLVFSDGSEFNTVNDHRIFNKEQGKFTYSEEETPMGTTTFNDKGEYITLVSKEVINKEVEFYNIITDYHMNLFAGTILTSCRYNNIYPIQNMKFIKENREHKSIEYFDVPEKYYYGLRLAEQPDKPTSINKVDMTTKEYVDRLERSKL